jgi:hypothetical protein
VRFAIVISLAALGLVGTARGDALTPCEVGAHGGYLVPVSYAEAHRADILATLPDEPTVDGFWQVTEQAAIVSDRRLRETLEDAIKYPLQLFPDLQDLPDTTQPDSLGYQRNEMKQIVENYGAYQRQYVGLVIDGERYVLLNYSIGVKADPATGFIFIHRVFEPGKMHFLHARLNWDENTVSNVSMYGPWQEAPP